MIEPRDYCALFFREPNRLRIVNSHHEVVEVVRTSFADVGIETSFYAKSQGSCAFKISGSPFSRNSEKSIKISRALALVVQTAESTRSVMESCHQHRCRQDQHKLLPFLPKNQNGNSLFERENFHLCSKQQLEYSACGCSSKR